MKPNTAPPEHPSELERRSRELLLASAEAVDGRTRSRLNQARHAALAALPANADARPFRIPGRWLPAGALAAAAVLAIAVWLARPAQGPGAQLADVVATEDAEMLASNDGPELYADDADFYEWAGSDVATATGGEG
jgi:ferric-dicitrate binding protein FerR (iron transport regulator)